MGDFKKAAKIIYKGCEQYVPDLDSDVRNLFKPEKNPGMKFSTIQPFVAYKDEVPVSRIVGIINSKAKRHLEK